MNRILRTAAVVAASVIVVGFLVSATPRQLAPGEVVETASSSTFGTNAALLMESAAQTPLPPRAAPKGVGPTITPAAGAVPRPSDAAVTWRSAGQTKGAWVTLTWGGPALVDRVRIDGAGGTAGAYSSALLTFSDGSNLLVTPDSNGNVSLDIAPRTVTTARLQFIAAPAGVSSIALHAFTVDRAGTAAAAAAISSSMVSASAGSSNAQTVVDGNIASGTVGAVWRPASSTSTGAATAWVGHSWASPVTVDSVQIAGSTTNGASHPGKLVFSDGSSVVVSGVVSGSQPVTTAAFAPRSVSWVRFEVTTPSAQVGEMRVYGPGTTPPTWPASGGVSVTPAAYGSCTITSTPVGAPQDSALALVCPETGASVQSSARVVVSGPVGQRVTATAWIVSGTTGSMQSLASTLIKADGRATIDFGLSRIPHGPFALKLTVSSSSVPLYIQLYNAGGSKAASPSFAPAGMTLQYADEFTAPLSATRTGSAARYAATKPAGSGGSEFGGAVFADPAWGLKTLGSFDDYMRLRVQPLGNRADPYGWGRTYAGALLSSARVGGSGVSAQYGYFEARILAPAGRGTWPAFWMLDTESAVNPSGGSGEVDAVELYGHNPVGSCHTLHNWPLVNGAVSGASCFATNGLADWALAWHTYGVRIRPNGADYFIDGQQITAKEGLNRDSSPYYFLFDLSVDGGYPVKLKPTGSVVDMYVDWVRVYS